MCSISLFLPLYVSLSDSLSVPPPPSLPVSLPLCVSLYVFLPHCLPHSVIFFTFLFVCHSLPCQVLSKLAEDTKLNQFMNKGTNYITSITNFQDFGRGSPGSTPTRNYAGRGGRGDMGQSPGQRRDIESGGGFGGGNINSSGGGSGGNAIEDIAATTTISIAVPELLVGNILGRNVRRLNHRCLKYFM